MSQHSIAMRDEEAEANEERLLRFLCHDKTDRSLRQQLLSRLRFYPFRKVEHQILFDCLSRIPWDRPEMVRSHLPAWLVRAGFPDFDLTPFLEAPDLTPADARTFSLELLRSGHF